MTKFGKILVVVLFCGSIMFFGIAAISASASRNVKAQLEDLKKESEYHTRRLNELQAQTPKVEEMVARTAEIKKNIPLDVAAMDRRSDLLARQLSEVNKEFQILSSKIQSKQLEIKGVRETAERLRNETVQLQAQLATLRAERGAAEIQERKLKDLLVQAEGILERAEQREEQLKADGAKP